MKKKHGVLRAFVVGSTSFKEGYVKVRRLVAYNEVWRWAPDDKSLLILKDSNPQSISSGATSLYRVQRIRFNIIPSTIIFRFKILYASLHLCVLYQDGRTGSPRATSGPRNVIIFILCYEESEENSNFYLLRADAYEF